jgi:hypothetical protein
MLWLALLEMLKTTQLELLQGFTALISILSGLYGRNWLALLAGGTCLGALVVTQCHPLSLQKIWGSSSFTHDDKVF